MKYSELIRRNREFESSGREMTYSIKILSNITITPIKDILEYKLRCNDLPGKIKIGNYDNILQDTADIKDTQAVIIFWELSNIIEGLQYKADLFSDNELESIIKKTKNDIDFVLNNLKNSPLVIMNLFSTNAFNNNLIRLNKFDKICNELNVYLSTLKLQNIIFIDINKVISRLSVQKCINFRDFYTTKSLYSIDFFEEYSKFILPIFLSINGKSKKALIFDCDNTLWEGILGEDEFKGIEMSSNSIKGRPFEEIQSIAIDQYKHGIIIGLCSKNNYEDIDSVLRKHPDLKLNDEYITIKKINWNSKDQNLKEMARNLNIGLDSFVFVDDSDFELNLIKDTLPEVTTIKVPENRFIYPQVLRENLGLFFNISESKEDLERNKTYKEQTIRQEEQKKYVSFEDYLKNLNLKLTIQINRKELIPRLAQLSQKTNQFNLTTKRYTESEINSFMENEDYSVLGLSLKDKFGDYGVTGLCILKTIDKKTIDIDTFLLSCRIIGRNVEFAFFNYLVNNLKSKKFEKIQASYITTAKNQLVHAFYDNLKFINTSSTTLKKQYELEIYQFKPMNVGYFEISQK
jgi:FkbH-like protein